jgi:hypothetical protein
MYVARYNPNGAPETTCRPNGNGLVIMSIDPAANTKGTPLLVRPDGHLLVSGEQGVVQNSVPSFVLMVARSTSAGAPDPAVECRTGFLVHDEGGSESMWDMAAQLDGKSVVARETSHRRHRQLCGLIDE